VSQYLFGIEKGILPHKNFAPFTTDGRQKEYPACKIEWWGAGVVICLERGTNGLHVVQLMPLSL